MPSHEFQPLNGMSDLTSPEIAVWQMIEERSREVFRRFGINEIRTPVLENRNLFVRSLGDTTDVVQKEMYTLEDRGGRQLALRPEGTAGVMRFIAGGGPEAERARLYYIGPMFRAERPQAGRRRQFHQVGVELLGEPSPAQDAECIALQCQLMQSWGLKNYGLQINTRGTFADREIVAERLREDLKPHLNDLCGDCRRRYNENVLRILDCKVEACRRVVGHLQPVIEYMGTGAREYLDKVLEYLCVLDISPDFNPRLVRGLDYYVHTVWEITHPALGAQDSISGGGRYCIPVGGRETNGVGFAMGVERVVAALEGEGIKAQDLQTRPAVWVVSLGENALSENLVLAMMLRERGVACELDLSGRSMKAQMRSAGRSGAPFVVIRGDEEIESGTFLLKDMENGVQDRVDMPDLLARVAPHLDVIE